MKILLLGAVALAALYTSVAEANEVTVDIAGTVTSNSNGFAPSTGTVGTTNANGSATINPNEHEIAPPQVEFNSRPRPHPMLR